jgi:protein TonB
MIKKKNDRSDLEKKRVLFFEMGIILVLSMLLVAFEWGNKELLLADNTYLPVSNDMEIEEMTEITRPEVKKVKPPAPPTIIIEIDNDDDFEDPDFDFSVEVNEDTEMPFYDFEPDDEVEEDIPLYIAEHMPTYKGKDQAYFQRHLQQLVVYPKEAQENSIEGRVFLQFVVNRDGRIIDATIVKSPHPSLSEAVLNAIDKTDKWTPGEQMGRKVKVRFTIPIIFTLQ